MKVSINVCFLCHLNAEPGTEDNRVCTTCHRELKKIVFYRGEAFNHMKPRGKDYSCSRCHSSVKIGEGTVSKKKCFFCHVDRAEKYSDVEFVHEQHIGKKQMDCFFCHEFIEHGNIKISGEINGIIKTK